MKKLTLILILILTITGLCSCYKDVEKLAYTDTGYEKGDWDKAQGLAHDDEYFYFAGHHDKTNENADIHVIDRATMKEVKVLAKVGAMHSAGMDAYAYHDTLLTSSGGNGRKPFVYEIDKTDGKLLNSWDFAEVGEKSGACIAVIGENRIVLFTSIKDGARIAFTEITLLDDGQYVLGDTVFYNEKDLGVPQGLAYYDGKLYYLVDAGITVNVNPHYLYRLDAKTFAFEGRVGIKISAETQDITIDDGTLYFATAKEKIYKADKKLSDLSFG